MRSFCVIFSFYPVLITLSSDFATFWSLTIAQLKM